MSEEHEDGCRCIEELCDHGVTFDEAAWHARPNMSPTEVRVRWPRLLGKCPRPGCTFEGIAYASYIHYLAGEW